MTTPFAVTKSLDAAATNTTGAAASTDSSTLGGVPVTGVLIHIFGDGATTSSTTIEQSLDKVAWAPALYTVTNVSASGVIVAVPPAPYTRAKTVCSSGAVSAYIIPSADVVATSAKTTQQASASGLDLTNLGAASATSLATSAATPLLLTNGQLVNVALTSQTVGATTLTIPDFASVVDEFVFKTKAVTMSNKTFVAPVLGAATATSINKVALTAPAAGSTLTIADGKTLTVNNSVTLAGTDSTTMTFPATSATIARSDRGVAKLTDGAIAIDDVDIFITKGSALGASTLATPVAGTDDGKTMTFTSTTAFAHVITVETGKVNGAAATGITFTSAAIGDSFTLKMWQGIAYIVATRGTITLA